MLMKIKFNFDVLKYLCKYTPQQASICVIASQNKAKKEKKTRADKNTQTKQ